MKLFNALKTKNSPTKDTVKNEKSPTQGRELTKKTSPFHIGATGFFRALWFTLGIAILLVVGVAFFAPIVKDYGKVDYFSYVSELRSNILLAQDSNFSLRAYAVEKEHPYLADGIKREMTKRAEIHLVAPEGGKMCKISFSLGKESFHGEMSYDNVKEEYYFSVSADLTTVESVDFELVYGKDTKTLHAKTVKRADTLTPTAILEKLRENESATFDALTDKNGFVGEIYVRLICENEPYYYVGLIEKSGKIRAYLLSADTGKLLAKRES